LDGYSEAPERMMQLYSISQASAFQLMRHTAGFARQYSKLPKIPSLEGLDQIYAPCLPSESAKLLKNEESGDPDIAEHVIESLDSARRARWEETTSKLDPSGRKYWSLVRKLGAAKYVLLPCSLVHLSLQAKLPVTC